MRHVLKPISHGKENSPPRVRHRASPQSHDGNGGEGDSPVATTARIDIPSQNPANQTTEVPIPLPRASSASHSPLATSTPPEQMNSEPPPPAPSSPPGVHVAPPGVKGKKRSRTTAAEEGTTGADEGQLERKKRTRQEKVLPQNADTGGVRRSRRGQVKTSEMNLNV